MFPRTCALSKRWPREDRRLKPALPPDLPQLPEFLRSALSALPVFGTHRWCVRKDSPATHLPSAQQASGNDKQNWIKIQCSDLEGKTPLTTTTSASLHICPWCSVIVSIQHVGFRSMNRAICRLWTRFVLRGKYPKKPAWTFPSTGHLHCFVCFKSCPPPGGNSTRDAHCPLSELSWSESGWHSGSWRRGLRNITAFYDFILFCNFRIVLLF